MPIYDEQRPDPDILLENINYNEPNKKGKLKIFFGYAAGVGKTYAMLDDAQELYKSGIDVLVGYVEPHTRPETMELLSGLPTLPPVIVPYKNIQLKEFDLDSALKIKPQLILVDELAHTNAFGVRNKKRYQDIEELLNAGIDVYSTLNVQHLESFNDIVYDITKVNVRETIPDYIFDNADKVKLIDIEPEELLKRLEEGKVYRPERAETALKNFFSKENLRLLHEIAMRKAADRISNVNQNKRVMAEKKAGIKFLVCVGSSLSSSKCIRWASRTAEAFHAPWAVVYVENLESQYNTERDKKNIQTNLELARRLGAEIVILNGDDVASVVSEYAKLSGITNIVIGKSRNKKRLKSLFEMDFEDSLISLLPNVEIHIIPGYPVQSIHRESKGIKIKKKIFLSWYDISKTIGLLTAATLVSIVLQIFNVGDQNIIMVYIFSVLIVSRITTGYIYGLAASLLSVIVYNYFFTYPYFTFNATQPGYPFTFVIMFLIALVTSALTNRIKTQARLALERERRTEVLYEINKELLKTRGLDNIVSLTNEYLVKLFGRSVIFYIQDPANGSQGILKQSDLDEDCTFLLQEDECAVAHWVFINQKIAGAGTDTLMGADAFYIPVTSQSKVLGVIGISCLKENFDQNNRSFLQIISSLVAMALERQHLSDDQHKILIETEKEKMRSNLLRAISHDLRTPLTGILGSCSTILEGGNQLSKETHDKLLYNIKEDSQWLIRMVENLLSVTRINEGTMNVSKSSEAAEEIIAEAISRIRKRFPNSAISVKVPDELLLVPMDGTLIEQVLINLLENAIKHSPENSNIEVVLKKIRQFAVFEVIDNGSGVAEEDFPYLFENFVHNWKRSPDSTRGMGIGLSICMSIIKAHNGKLEAFNKKTGGAVFRFSLPLEGSDNND